VGGTAVILHGHTRGSHNLPRDISYDYDIWYKPTTENFSKVSNAFEEIRKGTKAELDKIVFDPDKTYLKISDPPYNLELLPTISGFTRKDFDKIKSRSMSKQLKSNQASIISLKDLMTNKKSTNRPIDQSDIKALRSINERNSGRNI